MYFFSLGTERLLKTVRKIAGFSAHAKITSRSSRSGLGWIQPIREIEATGVLNYFEDFKSKEWLRQRRPANEIKKCEIVFARALSL